uniref:Uncharacterized protein n=1 Tax=Panagrolaimus sp. PS1159 TaxID=55785 RepID=A0AC35F632_9BILA
MTLSMTPASKQPSNLNIMADPRVFRGSVVARQREEINRCRQEIEARKAEERYRMEVVRNRLSMALSNDISKPNPISYRRAANIRAETSARLAKLAGKTGKSAIADWAAASKEKQPFSDEKGIDRHSPRKAIPTLRRRLSPINNSGRKKVIPRIESPKVINGFHHRLKNFDLQNNNVKGNLKNVRFIPLKNESPRNGPHKVVPSIPSSSSLFDESRQKGGGRRRFYLPLLPTLTPPQSPYGPIYHNDACVQTDEGFEEAFYPMISEMAETAINDALKNLKDEEDFRIMEEQNEKLLNIVVSEKRRNSELNLSILKHIRTEHEIAREREMAWHQLKAIDSHQMATQLISNLIEKCTENLADHGLIEDTCKVRSIGADTRQLEKHQAQLKAATLEIQRDFFPYVYAKAEKIFVHKLADSYLHDALFSKNAQHRAEARTRLNEQIQKYQKISRGISLSNYQQQNYHT